MADLVNLIEKKLSDGCFAKKLKKEGCFRVPKRCAGAINHNRHG